MDTKEMREEATAARDAGDDDRATAWLIAAEFCQRLEGLTFWLELLAMTVRNRE